MPNTIIAINKPVGPTSHDIIDQVRRITGEKRVGHAGTLDPRASGVLVVAIGREATKKLSTIVAKEKEYQAIVQLGQTSTTDDGEGEKTFVSDRQPTQKEISAALAELTGTIDQVPPIYSAIKQAGQKAYEQARRGQAVELSARPVVVKSINLDAYNYPIIHLTVVTGPGVYIRSLARDLGEKLKTGAYLAGLTRTRVGEFSIDQTLTLEQLAKSV